MQILVKDDSVGWAAPTGIERVAGDDTDIDPSQHLPIQPLRDLSPFRIQSQQGESPRSVDQAQSSEIARTCGGPESESEEKSENSPQYCRELAPRVGFEPTTLRLTAGRSTIELPRNGQRTIVALILLAVCKQCQSNPLRRRRHAGEYC